MRVEGPSGPGPDPSTLNLQPSTTMKLLTIIYDSSIEDSMIQLVEDLEVPGFTRFTDLQGRGGRGPKQMNPIFPGSNNVLLVAMPDEQVDRVRRAIRRL